MGLVLISALALGCSTESKQDMTTSSETKATTKETTKETKPKETVTEASSEQESTQEVTEAETEDYSDPTGEETKVYTPVYRGTNGYIVTIDAGHQQYANLDYEPNGPGSDTMKYKVSGGTSGIATGKPEFELTLEIALKLRDELTNRGYSVVMVRESNEVDISNAERAMIANDAGSDAFIRIHGNGLDDQSVAGAVTLCQTPDNPYNGDVYSSSRYLSDCVLQAYCEATGIRYMYVSETDTMTGINWARVPNTILELGFMTNYDEDLKMSDQNFQDSMVYGIANGIDMYFGL